MDVYSVRFDRESLKYVIFAHGKALCRTSHEYFAGELLRALEGPR